MNAMSILDSIVLASLWWAAGATLVAGHEVRNWRGAFLTVSLVGVMVFSFVGAIAAAKGYGVFRWWLTRGLVYSLAVVAVWLYDYRFGVIRHARMAGAGVLNKKQRIGEFYSRVRNFRKGKSA